MSGILKEKIVQLGMPITYHAGSDEVEAGFVTLLAPTSKNLAECGRIKQGFMRAAVDISERNSKNGSDDSDKKEDSDDGSMPSGEEVMQMIYISNVDVTNLLLEFREMLKNVGLLEGEYKMTSPIISSLSPFDIENLLGEYIANFIAASMSGNQKGK